MTKVYVVTKGCYSDYYIKNVFSTEEKAQEYLEILKNYCVNPSSFERDEYKIEDFELDKETPSYGSKKLFHVFISRERLAQVFSEDIDEHMESCLSYPLKIRDGKLSIYILANDRDHAVKIANEKLTEYLLLEELRRIQNDKA